MVSARRRLRAVLARRSLHVQLPAPARRRGPVPFAGGRVLRRHVPGDDGGAAAAGPAAQRRVGSQRAGGRPDPDRRPLAPGVDRADGAVPAPGRPVGAGEDRVGRLPGRRRDPDRGHRAARARRRPARAGVPPAHREHGAAPRHGLHLRAADAARAVRPPALAGRRMDRVLPPLGRRRPASLDGPARPARTRPGDRAQPLPARHAHVRVARRPRDRDHARPQRRRSRLHRGAGGVDHPVRTRGRPDGGARPPAGPLARARAPAQRRRSRARRRDRAGADRPGRRRGRGGARHARRGSRVVPHRAGPRMRDLRAAVLGRHWSAPAGGAVASPCARRRAHRRRFDGHARRRRTRSPPVCPRRTRT